MIRKTFDLLMPVLIPSWRFFMTVGPSPRVEVSIDGAAWRESHPVPAHVPVQQMISRLFHNPERNTQLYLVALAERLVAVPNGPMGAHSQAELKRLIAERHGAEGDALQFRLVFVVRDGAELISETVLESEPFAAGAVS